MSTKAKLDPKEALLRAAEKILISSGYAGVTTRRLAAKAKVNQALVHYHFGSIDEVFLRVLERVGERVNRMLKEEFRWTDMPRKMWHDHLITTFTTNIERGYVKVWFEVLALAANRPDMQPSIRNRFDQIFEIYKTNIVKTLAFYGKDPSDYPVDALAATIQAVSYGMFMQKLLGYDRGHDDIVALADQLVLNLEAEQISADH